MLLFSAFPVITRNLITPISAVGNASFTGKIFDRGIDTDVDGKYDYLEVAFEIHVMSPSGYNVEVPYLIDPQNKSYYYVWLSRWEYLSEGIQLFNLSFYGPKIYASKFNVSAIGDIRLRDDYWNLMDNLEYAALSRTYNYTDFDCRAVFTGKIYDEGIDTDGDDLFNSLKIGVEMNVTDPAYYLVAVSGLYGTCFVNVYNSSNSIFLEEGFHILNVSLDGIGIYASHGNISMVHTISLYVFEGNYAQDLSRIYDLQLGRTYRHSEFDPLAFFTGVVFDEGIDEEPNGLFDYFKISIEINVTDPGCYFIDFYNLVDNYHNYMYEYQSFRGEFKEKGLYLINFTIYGPKIYSAHLSPVYIEDLRLFYVYQWNWILIERRIMVPLTTFYEYTQFESHAFLTGKVYNRGVDTDADYLFDYLEVGVEVNVTETGIYSIYANGLAEEIRKDGETEERCVSHYQCFSGELDLGIHVINFTFPGPMIAYYHMNPTNVTDLTIIEPYFGVLSQIWRASLSRKYNYTEFNSPFNDMQVEFTVYPNATVGIKGSVNSTRIYYPYYYPPLVNASLGFSTIGDVTTGSANGTIILPSLTSGPLGLLSLTSGPRMYLEYPPYSLIQLLLNSTTLNFASEYYNGMLNAQLNATVALPPEIHTLYPFNSSGFTFRGTYSNGMLNADLRGNTELPSFIASQFPFNVTDAIVRADYRNNEAEGNITFSMLSGFPLTDVIVHFSGNTTEVSFMGNITVMYGNYFGTEINATVLEQTLSQLNSTIPGRGADSLYHITQGMIECTKLNTTTTQITGGAIIDYYATISGNFTQLLAQVIAGPYANDQTRSIIHAALNATLSSVDHAYLLLNYYHIPKMAFLNLTLSSDVKALWDNAMQLIPPEVPPEYRDQCIALLKIANITAYAVKDANLDVDYSSVTHQLNVRASLTANITQLKNETFQILPETVPPQYRDFVNSCINTTYCTLELVNATCTYAKSVINFDADWLLKGNFTKEFNRIKRCYIDYLNLTSPWMINWQTQLLNTTEIDLGNFKSEIKQGKDWMTLAFEGLKIHPIKEEMDNIRFKLSRLFDIISGSGEPPKEFERLKITIIGGTDGNQTILLYAPSTIPSPDIISPDSKIMTWQNMRLSSLRDLIFQIAYQEIINYAGNTFYMPVLTNSTITSSIVLNPDPQAPSISFQVFGESGMGFCNVTIPRTLIDAQLMDWTVLINGTSLPKENFTVTQNEYYTFISLTYKHSYHTIEIRGTYVIQEFSPNMLPSILIILSFIVIIIAIKQRKRLNTLKIKGQILIHNFAKTLHQSRT